MRLIDADALKQQFEGDPFEDFGAGYVLCVIDEAPTLALVCQAKWIPCSEQMPEEGQSVLAVVDGNVREAGYSYDAFSGSGFYRDAREIEWWMPLPNPPKGGATVDRNNGAPSPFYRQHDKRNKVAGLA